MANAGYIVALIVAIGVLAMLLSAAHLAAHRIKNRRLIRRLEAAAGEAAAETPFEPAPAGTWEAIADEIVRIAEAERRMREKAASSDSSVS